jgi:hypothetical protein
MKKIRSVLSRLRLFINVLALGVVFGCLYVLPVSADPGRECDGGCIAWDAVNGCSRYQVCCVYDGGSYQCWQF